MDVTFASAKLEKSLSEEAVMVKTYGQLAKSLKLRLTVLKNADCLDDVPKEPPDRCHQLANNRDEQFAVTLKQPKRLVFEVANDPVPRREDGGVDLKNVTAIRVVEIVDYH